MDRIRFRITPLAPLVRYVDPEQFGAFADELLERSAKTAITLEVSVGATRGEL